MILLDKRITKALISLRGESASVLFANPSNTGFLASRPNIMLPANAQNTPLICTLTFKPVMLILTCTHVMRARTNTRTEYESTLVYGVQFTSVIFLHVQSKLFITSLVITEYSLSGIKLLGTDLFTLKFPLYNRIFT